MLRFLRIRNLAVIETVEVEFGPGLNVLTGETGAGKSMLVDAVGLLLGARATADLVRTGEALATVEALFESPDRSELVLRREITSQGRSRAYLNGDLTTIAAVREAAGRAIELYGQHEHQALLDPQTHLALLDQFAATGGLANRVAAAWQRARELREQVRACQMDAREKAARVELIDFQLAEITRVAPKAGEDDELEGEQRVLASAEHVRELSETAYDALYESEHAALASLASVWRRTEELSRFDQTFEAYLDARDGIKSQLEELARALRARAEELDGSPGRLEAVTERLVALDGVKRKYGPSLDEVVAHGASLEAEHELLGSAGTTIGRLQAELAAAEQRYLEEARRLSAARRSAGRPFARALEGLLQGLAMQARFEVRFGNEDRPPETWTVSGIDEVEFYLSPNPGEDLRPLVRIASGGELSRIMLALKTLGAGRERRAGGTTLSRTLVFDEVDAGIGGRVAGVVGRHLRTLGTEQQVLCITHLPQIAAHGAIQFRIEKSVLGTRTVTSVERLAAEGRVDEVARMIGGGSVTGAVRDSAAELLAGAGGQAKESRRRKAKAKGEGR